MREVVIVDALRTPIGRYAGALSPVRPDDMAALVIKAVVERTGIDPNEIEEVYMGCANQAGEDNRNVARMATLLAGLPRSCSGRYLQSVVRQRSERRQSGGAGHCAGRRRYFHRWRRGKHEPRPVFLPQKFPRLGAARQHHRLRHDAGLALSQSQNGSDFPAGSDGRHGRKYLRTKLRRRHRRRRNHAAKQQDAFAFDSQRKACEAINNGYFKREIVPVPIPQRKGDPIMVDTDEHPRIKWDGDKYALDTSPEVLAKLRPAFRKGGTVTAGNASGLNDGAAALVLMTAEKAQALGLKPMARWVASAAAGVDPRVMGLGPVGATRKVLKRAGFIVGSD